MDKRLIISSSNIFIVPANWHKYYFARYSCMEYSNADLLKFIIEDAGLCLYPDRLKRMADTLVDVRTEALVIFGNGNFAPVMKDEDPDILEFRSDDGTNPMIAHFPVLFIGLNRKNNSLVATRLYADHYNAINRVGGNVLFLCMFKLASKFSDLLMADMSEIEDIDQLITENINKGYDI